MTRQEPTTEMMKVSEVRGQFNSLVNRAYRQETRVIVEKSGIPVAGIVSVEDIKRLNRLDADLANRRRVLEAMRAPFRGVPPEEIERETDRILAEIREENRQQRQVAVTAP